MLPIGLFLHAVSELCKTVKILAGSSIVRNQTLHGVALVQKNTIPYRGLGTGIPRIKALEPQVEFINAHDTFTVRLPRKPTVS